MIICDVPYLSASDAVSNVRSIFYIFCFVSENRKSGVRFYNELLTEHGR